MLKESISIIELPDKLSTVVVNQCNKLWRPKLPLIEHQHGIELVFPNILYEMSLSAKNGLCDINPLTNNNDKKILYYVNSYVYHTVYCTDKKNFKEDWTKRDPYWLDVANYIIKTNEWKHNMGINFLISASSCIYFELFAIFLPSSGDDNCNLVIFLSIAFFSISS